MPPSASSPFPDVSRLLAPRSIAVIGASDQPGTLGGVAIRLLQKFGYPGAVWPINPRRPDVHGIPCHARIADLPEPADLALFATGAESIPGLVRECAAAGTRCGIAWAGGFVEVGAHGAALQQTLAEACRDTGFALAGPNCIGIIDSHLPMTASFASFLVETDTLVKGDISMVSQSGGTATMAQAFAQQAGFGFRYMISSGNEAVLTIADYLYALAHDPKTKVIAAYIEGVKDGPRLIAALDAARAAGKPVVMLKGGATATSARAAVAHTGALAGEGRVWDGVLRDAGVIHVHSLEALLDNVLFLSSADPATWPRGNGLAAVTFGGGGGVLAADQASRVGLVLPPLTAATRARLRPLVPPIASIENPVDVTPQVYNHADWFAHFAESLDVIAADPGIHAVLLQFGPMAQRAREVAQVVLDFRKRTAKTVCLGWPLAPRGIPEFLRENGMHVFVEYARAVGVLGKLAGRHAVVAAQAARAGATAGVAEGAGLPPFDWSAHLAGLPATGVISEHDCHRLLAAAGLAVAAGRLVRSEDEAAAAAVAVGLPVAMKGISPAVTHRAAAGLLELGIAGEAEARAAYRALAERAAAASVALDGVYVQHMVAGGVEILVSAFRDPVFGPIVSLGAGGNFTELIDDVTLQRAPVTEAEVLAMIARLRVAGAATKLRTPPDPRLLARYVMRVGEIAASAPWSRFVLEINPVKWRHDGVAAVDGLLVIEAP